MHDNLRRRKMAVMKNTGDKHMCSQSNVIFFYALKKKNNKKKNLRRLF